MRGSGAAERVQRPPSDGGLWRLRHNTARPDIVGADQAQPIEPLLVGQFDAVTQRTAPRQSRAGASRRKGPRTTGGMVDLAFRPDPALAARQQPHDVGAVHNPQQYGEQ